MLPLTGCLIKRHKIPLPTDNSHYYQLLDLNIGVTVEFYGKRFKIIGVDNFTRDFLKKAGVHVPENLSMPVDPYFVNREEVYYYYILLFIHNINIIYTYTCISGGRTEFFFMFY